MQYNAILTNFSTHEFLSMTFGIRAQFFSG